MQIRIFRDKKIDKKVEKFLSMIMKLNKSLNSNIYYCFGNKTDSLTLLKKGKTKVFVANQEISLNRFVMADQTHSTEIKVIEERDIGSGFLAAKPEIEIVDGFVTNLSNTFIVIKGADCTPILVYAKSCNVIGGCHSGRQGTKNSIVKNLIQTMVSEFKILTNDLVVMIGPAISGAHYQVSEEIYKDFLAATEISQEYRQIDMQKVIEKDILELGVLPENIYRSKVCTYANSDYFSYRRDKTKERQISIIGIIDGKIYK